MKKLILLAFIATNVFAICDQFTVAQIGALKDMKSYKLQNNIKLYQLSYYKWKNFYEKQRTCLLNYVVDRDQSAKAIDSEFEKTIQKNSF